MSIKHLIISLGELYKKIFEKEFAEFSADFYLDAIGEQAEANKKKLYDIGFWDKQGNYIEDYQEIIDLD
jgi:hypothetical protein